MKRCLSNTAGLKECDHFPFPSLPPFNLLSVICMATACSVLLFPLIFFFPLLEKNLLVWVQFLIHIGSGRWISPSCSPSLFHLAATLLFRVTQSLHGYSKWMNMLRARAECIYFHKYHPRIIIPLLPPKMSGESFIISKTAHLKAARVYHRRVRKQINKHVSLKKTDYSEDLRVGKWSRFIVKALWWIELKPGGGWEKVVKKDKRGGQWCEYDGGGESR